MTAMLLGVWMDVVYDGNNSGHVNNMQLKISIVLLPHPW
jgi:hypothetical protein